VWMAPIYMEGYGRFSGKLLIIVAFDADNGVFSFDYALVKEENNVN